MKCIIILSTKSSGSSICQKLLTTFADVNVVNKTPHYQNETLYWTKAASILGLPQKKMLDSSVPYSADRSYQEIIKFLGDNIENYTAPTDVREMIFEGWAQLCEEYAPIFLEKSPHHLFQWSSLELMLECMNILKDKVDFLLIGLVRNPMDVLYSAFRRWRTPPEKLQYEWFEAYENLLKLKEILGEGLAIMRYEDITQSISFMQPVFDFCDVKQQEIESNFLHRKSIAGWKKDSFYGFSLADDVRQLAVRYGYSEEELANENSVYWPTYRYVSRYVHFLVNPVKMKILDSKIRGVQ
jgi:hypothetical protein